MSAAARRGPAGSGGWRDGQGPPGAELLEGPASAGGAGARRRLTVGVLGVVQGVGFRPFVYRLATELGLAGTVRNDGEGVLIDVEGGAEPLGALVERLRSRAPRLAKIEELRVRSAPVSHARGFAILESDAASPCTARVGPDVAPCDACLAELLDPLDRRYRYPFVNCTDCGPRYTIVRSLPYDRSRTAMAAFEMCAACLAEYHDPGDRRFHAQPNACAACGPRARLVGARDPRGAVPPGAEVGSSRTAPRPPRGVSGREAAPLPEGGGAPDAVALAATALLAGAIVAVKGLGGYHIACRADDARVVARLRVRKRREAKPFALMVSDVEASLRLVSAGPEELDLLTSPARPIVLAPRRPDAPVVAGVAPRHRDLGVMLPATPLHHLLTRDAGVPLVMTSGNLSDQPTLHDDGEALDALAGVVDLFLVHDRRIEARADDSVVRIASVGGRRRPITVRRARGYVPASLELPGRGPDVLATGADLKSTACVTRGARAWLSPSLGDLERWETRRAFREEVPRLVELARARPARVAHDLHPGYASTAYALEEHAELPPVSVQHHHAHLAAGLVEHGRVGPALGAILDGTGYGPDRTVWGGELLLGDLASYRRVGHLVAVALPGGDAAARQPWRMACAWLAAAGRPPAYVPAPLAPAVDRARWRAVRRLVDHEGGIRTTSAGRLFDAVSALCGLCAEASYEGQAALELEAVASTVRGSVAPYRVELRAGADGTIVLDPRETIRCLARDADRGVPVSRVAAAFHEGLACAITRALRALARLHGVGSVVLSGGVFQNVLLLERVSAPLVEAGLEVLVPELVPVNDGGLALGQAAVARWTAGPFDTADDAPAPDAAGSEGGP